MLHQPSFISYVKIVFALILKQTLFHILVSLLIYVMRLFKVLFSIYLLTSSLLALSQEVKPFYAKHYLTVSVGPSFKTATKQNYSIEQTTDGKEYHHNLDFGLGGGTTLALGYMYMFNKELGIELGYSHLFGSVTKFQNKYIVPNNGDTYSLLQDNEYKSSINKFNLLLVGKITYQKISPYFKLGVIVSTGNKVTKKVTEDVTFVKTKNKAKGDFEYLNTGGTSFGFNSVLGIDVPITKVGFFFVELNYTALAHSFEKWETKKSLIDGKDNMSTLSSAQRGGYYSETQPSNYSYNLTWKPSLSSFSVMIGLKFALQRPKVEAFTK